MRCCWCGIEGDDLTEEGESLGKIKWRASPERAILGPRNEDPVYRLLHSALLRVLTRVETSPCKARYHKPY